MATLIERITHEASDALLMRVFNDPELYGMVLDCTETLFERVEEMYQANMDQWEELVETVKEERAVRLA